MNCSSQYTNHNANNLTTVYFQTSLILVTMGSDDVRSIFGIEIKTVIFGDAVPREDYHDDTDPPQIVEEKRARRWVIHKRRVSGCLDLAGLNCVYSDLTMDQYERPEEEYLDTEKNYLDDEKINYWYITRGDSIVTNDGHDQLCSYIYHACTPLHMLCNSLSWWNNEALY